MNLSPSNPRPFSDPNGIASPPKTYRVGTLVYGRAALLNVLFWMLWGDFCLVIMESLLPCIAPLQLRWAGAGDTLVGFLTNSLPAAIGIFLNPLVGLQSDQCRSALGRRRPFLLLFTPPVVVSLLLLGWAEPGGKLLQQVMAPILGESVSAATLTIIWIAACTVLFVIFNTYVMQVYQFLFADVIPGEVMGRFIGCYRAVGALGGFAFNRWALGWVETHTFEVYTFTALLYAFAFLLLVWRVKEGQYPPPPPKEAGFKLSRAVTALRRYGRECFGQRFYLNIYCLPFFFWSALVPFQTFILFFATQSGQAGYAETLGLSLDAFGKIKGWTLFVQIPVFFLVGPLVDKFHPLRIAMVGLFLTGFSYFACFICIRNSADLLTWWIVNQIASAIFLGAYLAIFPRLFPREKYGQFFSANQIFGFVGVVIAPVLCGWMLQSLRDYRLIFVWSGVSTFLAFGFCVTLFRHWKRLGGDRNYTPPGQHSP